MADEPAPSREDVLKLLKLKTIIKEHHGEPLRTIAINHIDPGKANLFATVGSNQVTVYDNEHFGSYIQSVQQFVNATTESTQGGELSTCCWLSSITRSAEQLGDSLLAVGGSDKNVSVISMTSSAVICLLKGHTKEVTDLAACAARPNLVASASGDGTVRVWDILTEECAAIISSKDPTAVCFKEDGRSILVGTSGGQILDFPLPDTLVGTAQATPSKRKRPAAAEVGPSEGQIFASHGAGSAIDCLRAAPRGRVMAKSADGRVSVWDGESRVQLAAWKIPGSAGGKQRISFSLTADGEVLTAGNVSGDVYCYRTKDGAKLAHFPPTKVRAPVLAAAMSEDGRHVLAAYGGFLFRHEWVRGWAGAGGGPLVAAAGGGAAAAAAEDVEVGDEQGAAGDDDDDPDFQ